MIPVLTGKQVRKIDQHAIEQHKVPSLDLMEAAGRGAYEFLESVQPDLKKNRVLVLCGKGNNGGDGFVIARALIKDWVKCTVATTTALSELSPDALNMAKKFKQTGGKIIHQPKLSKLDQLIEEADLIVDALLGTGIQKNVRSPYSDWIERVNASRKAVLALDIPSGLHVDTGRVLGKAIEADWTATFAFMKLGLTQAPGCEHAGEIAVIDIGIPTALKKKVRTPYRLVEANSIRSAFQIRSSDTHKGNYGHVLIIAGSPTKLGAALMTAKSCLRSGAGLATLALPEKAFTRIPQQFLELMYEPVNSTSRGELAATAFRQIKSIWNDKKVIALGPGIGVNPSTKRLVRSIVENTPVPLVIDADGINCLQGHLASLSKAPRPVVLTPHPGEMARLLGITTRALQKDRIKYARRFAQEHQVTIVLKGYRTLSVFPDGKVYINPTGNPAMATAGMGDVLTGIISAFLSQGLRWVEAITAAVYLHGLAGDRLADRMGDRGLLAGDVIDSLPFVMKDFVPSKRKLHSFELSTH